MRVGTIGFRVVMQFGVRERKPSFFRGALVWVRIPFGDLVGRSGFILIVGVALTGRLVSASTAARL
jgi:hypothetical protein